MNLTVITAPLVEPITLAEAKAHLEAGDELTSTQNTYIETLIAVARRYAENYMLRALVQQTLEATFDGFPAVIELPRPPLQSITHIKYIDTSGVLQTLDSSTYQTDTAREPGLVKPAYNESWPTVRNDFNPVQVRYVAGYELGAGSPTDYTSNIPDEIKHWMKIRVAQWFAHREPIVTGTIVADIKRDYIDGLLDAYKVWEF